MKNKLKYSGPLALYLGYYLLLVLSVTLVIVSFKLDVDSTIFAQMLLVGVGTAIISSSLILYSTSIDSRLDIGKWQANANHYYDNEGSFEYTYNGFSLVSQDGPILVKWKNVVKVESKERQVNDLRISCIDIYFSEEKFITVDSTISGFTLFEKRLKENMKDIWDKDQSTDEVSQVSIVNKSMGIQP